MRTIIFEIYSLLILLASAINLFANTIVDDCEGVISRNKLGYAWYAYDDSKDAGNSTLSNGDLSVKKSGDDYLITPSAGSGDVGAGMVLPYTLGPKYCTYDSYNYVGIGTMLCDSAPTSSIDLTGATAVTFYCRASVATTVDFEVVTKGVTDYAYYHQLINVTTSYQKFTIALSTGLGSLAQPAWTENPVAFNIKNVTRLQWQVRSDNPGTSNSGAIFLDDIIIMGGEISEWDICPTCGGAPGQIPFPSMLLSNFDHSPYIGNARGYDWYCYSDAPNRTPPVTAASQFSAITNGAIFGFDPTTPPILTIGPTTSSGLHGFNNTYGTDINFTLGPVFNKVAGDNTLIKPFVGIGTDLCNELGQTDFYNSNADGVVGVYFDYMLSTNTQAPNVCYLRLEVYDTTHFPDGAVHYLNLPATSPGVWKSATVHFSKSVLPKWDSVNTSLILNTTALKKLQWVVQDAAGTSGELAIDNVYFLFKPNDFPISVKPMKFMRNPIKAMSSISTSINNKNITVTFPQEMSIVSVTLINTKGSVVVKDVTVANHTAIVDVAGVARGMYMVLVKANSKTGAINKTMQVTVY